MTRMGQFIDALLNILLWRISLFDLLHLYSYKIQLTKQQPMPADHSNCRTYAPGVLKQQAVGGDFSIRIFFSDGAQLSIEVYLSKQILSNLVLRESKNK